MPDSPVLDGGARFPEVLTIRLPEGFLSRMKAAAEREGISHRDFARRAIAERLARATEPGGTTTGTETKTTPQPSLLQQILGGVSSGIGLLGQTGAFSSTGSGSSPGYLTPMLTSLFTASDERVKDNIAPVGLLNDGQTVYSYNYKGEPRTQIGLMAQEVAQHDPSAVAEGPHGLLMVDYGQATRRARRA